MEETTASIITLKLLIDTKANKVLFAEASRDFVDALCFLFSLPLCDVTRLLFSKSKLGSINNMYKNLEQLNKGFFLKESKLSIINFFTSFDYREMVFEKSSSPPCPFILRNYYSCKNIGCEIDEKDKIFRCCRCLTWTAGEKLYLTSTKTIKNDVEGYIPVSYMISDDLSMKEMNIISSISLMNELNVTQINVLKEKVVKLGLDEALELLKLSFYSKSVLTDVFLEKKEVDNEI